MAPEGATGYFPIDKETLNYMRLTNRSEDHIELTRLYAQKKITFLWWKVEPNATKVVEIDLSSIVPSISGPSVAPRFDWTTAAKEEFQASLVREVGGPWLGLDESFSQKVKGVSIFLIMREKITRPCNIKHY